MVLNVGGLEPSRKGGIWDRLRPRDRPGRLHWTREAAADEAMRLQAAADRSDEAGVEFAEFVVLEAVGQVELRGRVKGEAVYGVRGVEG